MNCSQFVSEVIFSQTCLFNQINPDLLIHFCSCMQTLKTWLHVILTWSCWKLCYSFRGRLRNLILFKTNTDSSCRQLKGHKQHLVFSEDILCLVTFSLTSNIINGALDLHCSVLYSFYIYLSTFYHTELTCIISICILLSVWSMWHVLAAHVVCHWVSVSSCVDISK